MITKPRNYKNRQMIYKDIGYKEVADSINVDFGDRTISGYAAVWNVKDEADHALAPAIFNKSIKEWGVGGKDLIRMLNNHAVSEVLGRPVELEADEYGLRHVTKITKVKKGKDFMTQVAEGMISFFSVGFEAMKYDFVEKNETAIAKITEGKLWEYSSTAMPVQTLASITSYKSKDAAKNDIAGRLRKLEANLATHYWESDLAVHMAILELKSMSSRLEKLNTTSLFEDNDEVEESNEIAKKIDEMLLFTKSKATGEPAGQRVKNINAIVGNLDLLIKELK